MYYLFTEKDILPNTYYNLRLGEKLVLKAFFEYQQENMDREIEYMNRIKMLYKFKGR